MEVICFEDAAYYKMIEAIVSRLKEQNNVQTDKWINTEQALKLLHISSRTTLQKLRDEGKIRFSKPSNKIIFYDRDSILEYLDKNSRNKF